ncbi:TB2/DP1, HVA22 family-domain-containing protein [Sphaerosporella brunnea]|uniref:Protein YOP1 n=1 Tax=Sphaerosporella brunnea TaxID=1250544 RepID=A0A5J5EPM0_9PEZI|nr:TB2/DP1, HVA22 family-domain-containing protein [Sphaerosporella brunnea]
MFDLLSKLICSIATFAFPIFASYKALKANDPAQLTPWLMYWIVLACVLCVESWVGWAVSWLPFYHDIRAGFMLWLVLPQTQGATQLYLEHVHPTLNKHEAEIEEFISRAHDQAKAAGAEYIQHLIDVVKQTVFGIVLPQAEDQPATPPPHDAASFAQALFSRWRVPPLTPYAPQMATDFYAFLSSALQQVPGSQAAGGSSNLIPPHVKGTAEKARFIELQRQRLKTVMAALETEMESIQGAGGVDTAAASADEKSGIHKSYSVGHLSSYEGDFDHVEMDDTLSPPATSAGGNGWFGSWGSRTAPKEHEHNE